MSSTPISSSEIEDIGEPLGDGVTRFGYMYDPRDEESPLRMNQTFTQELLMFLRKEEQHQYQ